MRIALGILVFWAVFFAQVLSFSDTEDIRFTFDEKTEGWDVPDWAFVQRDYVAGEVKISQKEIKEGIGSLEVICDFPGNRWAAALVELEQNMDFTEYQGISVDIFIPRNAPKGFFKARFVLTVGVGWHFVEMREPVELIPGKWVTLSADIEKKEVVVSAWKGRGERQLYKHLNLIKKVAVRIEYDASPPHTIGGRYYGPVFIDNFVIGKEPS